MLLLVPGGTSGASPLPGVASGVDGCELGEGSHDLSKINPYL